MFIKEFFKHYRLEISAPRRFGKTVNMDMLKSFFEIQTDINGNRLPVNNTENCKIFNGKYNGESLKIRKDSEFFNAHFGKYPVLHVNFRELKTENLAKFMKSFSEMISEIFRTKFKYLFQRKEKPFYLYELEIFRNQSAKGELNGVNCARALKLMSKVLNEEFNEQVIILIDGYDAPIQNMIFSPGKDVEEITYLISRITGNVLKDNPFVMRGLLNSCILMPRVLSFTANNVDQHLFMENRYFFKYYGFTSEEVDMLLSRSHVKEDRSTLESWYNGYRTIFFDGNGTRKVQLYNPLSITEYCEHEVLDSYWARPSFELNLRNLSFQSNIFDTVYKLLRRESVTIFAYKKISVDHVIKLKKMILTSSEISHDLYFHLLLQLGYLTITDVQDMDEFVLKIPNRELRNEIRKNYLDPDFPVKKFNTKKKAVDAYLKSISNLNDKTSSCEALLNSIIKIYEDKNITSETDLQEVLYMLPLVFSLDDHEIYSEFKDEERNTKLDVLIITGKKKGIIFETKYNQGSSEQALNKIIDGKYYKAFNKLYKNHIEKKIFIGLHVTKKKEFSLSYLYCSTDTKKAIHIPDIKREQRKKRNKKVLTKKM